MQPDTYLVIGADSFAGSALMKTLKQKGHLAIGTTRRKETLSKERIFLDLTADSFNIPESASAAFIVAADTALIEIGKDTYKTNVTGASRLADALLKKDIFTIYVSSNTVFGGKIPFPCECALPAPQMTYAEHKAEAENKILQAAKKLGAESNLAIVRICKILGFSTPPLPQWLLAWQKKQPVQPFSDFIFAPVSRKYLADSFIKIAEKKCSGFLHISGSENITYAGFAFLLAEKLGIAKDLIKPATSLEANITIGFKPEYSALGMKRTSQIANILPQPPLSVIDDIITELKQEKFYAGIS